MEFNLLTWIAGILAAGNSIQIIYSAWKMLKPQVKKMEAEEETENVHAANLNLEGAGITVNLLKGRIDELKADLEAEKEARKNDIEREQNARKEDRIYFTRRIKEIDREAKDYRLWAAKLAKQVIEAGKVPATFVPSTDDSDPLLIAINKSREELNKAGQVREEERKDSKNVSK